MICDDDMAVYSKIYVFNPHFSWRGEGGNQGSGNTMVAEIQYKKKVSIQKPRWTDLAKPV
jgi:hypothetical protein